MNFAAIRQLRRTLAGGQPAVGMWVTLEAPAITEVAVALGLDYVVVDAEHGHLDWKEILEHLRAAVRSNTVMLVRVAELNAGLIKRALDVGADGVVIPFVDTADQLRQAVAYARYPLEGRRGLGADRHLELTKRWQSTKRWHRRKGRTWGPTGRTAALEPPWPPISP